MSPRTGKATPAASSRRCWPHPGRAANVPDAAPTAETFLAWARANPRNAEILRRLPALGLPQCHLVAGCLFQAVWNRLSGQPADAQVRDYDVFYFDDTDLSYEAEDAVIRRAATLFADLGAPVELRNQARVHLWYPARFGRPYPRLASARDGIDRYLVACTCIGIEAASGVLYAPGGLADLWQGMLRINARLPEPALFRAKALSYQARWPWLTIVAPGQAGA
ncbi:MAG: nucleotidyltransferase family protein [Rhodospirillales bacterium]|nr:nucleotidyltransferase family protein [Rhodospirillales bacterium]MDE2198518.1 nucleotidyltransferase family protein [Rhodospirillales bacterium]MDE2576575.1 nucleotidyltransferase family protein [Rhodospirillales bacterium]